MTYSYRCPEGHDVTAPSHKPMRACPVALHRNPAPLVRVGEGSRKANAQQKEIEA